MLTGMGLEQEMEIAKLSEGGKEFVPLVTQASCAKIFTPIFMTIGTYRQNMNLT
jgi:hypothetical protein